MYRLPTNAGLKRVLLIYTAPTVSGWTLTQEEGRRLRHEMNVASDPTSERGSSLFFRILLATTYWSMGASKPSTWPRRSLTEVASAMEWTVAVTSRTDEGDSGATSAQGEWQDGVDI